MPRHITGEVKAAFKAVLQRYFRAEDLLTVFDSPLCLASGTWYYSPMRTNTIGFFQKGHALYKRASTLALITIFYNIAEGIVAVFFGLADESFSLFGFGLDSFVEVFSGIGIWHMVRRVRRNGTENPDRFERTALRITASGFFLLTAGLSITAAINLYQGHTPETTLWGIVISLVSILAMRLLIYYKIKIGRLLNSPAILADAACTRACIQLSVVLLIASAGYELTGIGGMDSLGTLVIAGLCWREGKETLEKARAGTFTCGCGGQCLENVETGAGR